MRSNIKWVERLTLEYAGKTPDKTTELPGTPVHEILRDDVHLVSSLIEDEPPSLSNYLAVNISFVVSDRGQVRGGSHKRTYVSFPLRIPEHSIYNSYDIYTNKAMGFRKTGHHTEQVLYEYLKTEEGQGNLSRSFRGALKEAIDSGRIQRLQKDKGENRKIYAMVIDMHSRLNMCTFTKDTMENSCAGATIAEQMPGNENLRAITARTLRNKGYIVSGYDRETKQPKEGKIGLKMLTRMSCTETYRSLGLLLHNNTWLAPQLLGSS